MQELIGYYIPMEEYYMRESVNKVVDQKNNSQSKAGAGLELVF